MHFTPHSQYSEKKSMFYNHYYIKIYFQLLGIDSGLLIQYSRCFIDKMFTSNIIKVSILNKYLGYL